MKILITTQDLQGLAGSKFAAYTVGRELARVGHDVTIGCIGEFNGPMSNYVRAYSPETRLASLFQLRDDGERFDVGIISPYVTLQFAIPLCERTVYWSQGIVPEERFPDPADFEVDSIVAITEEVADHWLTETPGLACTLIPTPIIRPRVYKSGGPSVKKVAHFSNYDDIPGLKDSCDGRGIEYVRLAHADRNTIWNELSNTDLIVSVGRGCYEAMALGKEVAICDMRNYMGEPWSDGLASQNYMLARHSNCSGRMLKVPFDDVVFANWLVQYDSVRAMAVNRAAIWTYHDSQMIANKLLCQAANIQPEGDLGLDMESVVR